MNIASRQEWVDYAKAIGIILVVYGHVAPGIFNAGLIVNEELYLLVQKFIYSFHMPLFFFLSGLFFWGTLNNRGTTGLIGSKIDTIVYAYLLWSLLQGLSEILLARFVTDPPTIKYVFSLLWQPRQQFWYLYALFMIFVIFACIFHQKKSTFITPIFIATILVYFLREAISGGGFYLTWVTDYSMYFIFGVLVTHYSLLEYLRKPHIIFITIALCALLHGINLLDAPSELYSTKTLSMAVAFTSIISVVIFSMKLDKYKIRWLLFVGSASMAIYVMHTFATAGTKILLVSVFSINNSFIHLTLGTLLGVGAPCLAYMIIQKYKIPFMFNAPISSIFLKKEL